MEPTTEANGLAMRARPYGPKTGGHIDPVTGGAWEYRAPSAADKTAIWTDVMRRLATLPLPDRTQCASAAALGTMAHDSDPRYHLNTMTWAIAARLRALVTNAPDAYWRKDDKDNKLFIDWDAAEADPEREEEMVRVDAKLREHWAFFRLGGPK